MRPESSISACIEILWKGTVEKYVWDAVKLDPEYLL